MKKRSTLGFRNLKAQTPEPPYPRVGGAGDVDGRLLLSVFDSLEPARREIMPVSCRSFGSLAQPVRPRLAPALDRFATARAIAGRPVLPVLLGFEQDSL